MTTSLESAILKLLLTREVYCKHISLIKNTSLLKPVTILISLIEKYYEKFTHHDYISVDELENWFRSQYPQIKDAETYERIFTQLRTQEVSDSLASDILKKLISRDWAAKTIEFLIPIAEGHEDGERLYELPEKFDKLSEEIKNQEEISSPFLTYSPEELFGAEEASEGLSWPLPGLDDALGRLPRRTLGHIFARVETGKTTLISHCITTWARSLAKEGKEELIVGFFNEENGRRIFSRTYHSLLNLRPQDCEAYRRSGRVGELEAAYQKNGGSNLKLVHDTSLSLNKIREVLESYPVRALVVDIADHVRFAGDSKLHNVERLNTLYRSFRDLSDKHNCDILTAGQAGEQASGRKNLYLEHMYDSKTAKPGALDYAIGIGATYDEPDRRWLCVCKNKLKASGYHVVDAIIDRERGRYSEV